MFSEQGTSSDSGAEQGEEELPHDESSESTAEFSGEPLTVPPKTIKTSDVQQRSRGAFVNGKYVGAGVLLLVVLLIALASYVMLSGKKVKETSEPSMAEPSMAEPATDLPVKPDEKRTV